jgi:hypothetical protein
VLSATSIMASILSLALAERMPLLEQCICTAQTSSLTKALLTHEMDMALVYLEDISEEDFDTHLLYRERIVVRFPGIRRPAPATGFMGSCRRAAFVHLGLRATQSRAF